ncbi:MAG: carbon-nitrogen hydrolase family protein [Chloroflexi bacterium]|nr:carbon-nitrogen hydrolase family protein [Chloroflexota bacterium]
MGQTLKVTGIQMGTYTGDYDSNMEMAVKTLDKAVNDFKPDIVCFSEVMTGPYFGCTYNDKYFGFAEPVPGKTTKILGEAARKHGIYVIGTVFEKAGKKYYSSAFVMDPTGKLITNYRKIHIGKSGDRKLHPTDEVYYFSPGNRDFPIFEVKGIKVGLLICFDRSFPESFRVLMLKGAQVVFAPVATFGARKDAFWDELKVRGMENHIFIVAVNKAGDEICEGEENMRHHFGRSCIIDPGGELIASLEDEPFGILTGTVDMSVMDLWRTIIDWRPVRRPRFYKIITKSL